MPDLKGSNLQPEDIRINLQNIKAPFASLQVQSRDGIAWSRTFKRDQTRQTAGRFRNLAARKLCGNSWTL